MMKIRISANSTVVRQALSQLNMECGYAYVYGPLSNQEIDDNSSWRLRVLSRLEQALPSLNKISTPQKEVVLAVGQTLKFLNEYYEGLKHIEDMHVTLNVSSPLNRILKKSIPLVQRITKSRADSMKESLDDMAGHINQHTKRMVLGTSLFLQKDSSEAFVNTLQSIVHQHGMQEAVQFVVFHEAMHAFERVNSKQHGVPSCVPTVLIYYASLLMDSDKQKELNQFIVQTHDGKGDKFSTVDNSFMQQIRGIYDEAYADCGAILLQRNKAFVEGCHDGARTESFIDTITKARQQEHLQGEVKQNPLHYVCRFNHFSSPAIEFLKDLLCDIPQRELSQEEIHRYCTQATVIGVARVLVASSIAASMLDSDFTNKQLKVLFNLSLGDNGLALPVAPDPEVYDEKMNELLSMCGLSWRKQLNDHLQAIKELDSKILGYLAENPSNKAKLFWLAAINQEAFKEEIDRLSKAAMLHHGDTMGSHSTAGNAPVKDKGSVLQAIGEMRQPSLGEKTLEFKL